jgi:hypothetical protein
VLHLNELCLEDLSDTVSVDETPLYFANVKFLEFCDDIEFTSLSEDSHCPELFKADCQVITVRNLIDHQL